LELEYVHDGRGDSELICDQEGAVGALPGSEQGGSYTATDDNGQDKDTDNEECKAVWTLYTLKSSSVSTLDREGICGIAGRPTLKYGVMAAEVRAEIMLRS
jgi:hypothetical protein